MLISNGIFFIAATKCVQYFQNFYEKKLSHSKYMKEHDIFLEVFCFKMETKHLVQQIHRILFVKAVEKILKLFDQCIPP